MFSEMESMKTENERRMEMPSEIFSPWSGGERNVTSVSEDSMTHGMMRFSVKKRCRRTRLNDAATWRIKMTRASATLPCGSRVISCVFVCVSVCLSAFYRENGLSYLHQS